MTVYLRDPDVTLYHGDVLETLRELPNESVDCVVTSPPYWGLRDYGTGSWEGGNPDCDHLAAPAATSSSRLRLDGRAHIGPYEGEKATQYGTPYRARCGKCGATRQDQQLGLEPTPDVFVARMVEVFREVRRVLAPHGTCWVNLGDSYASGGGAGLQGANGQMAGRSVVKARLGRNDAGRDFTGGGGNREGSGNPGNQGTVLLSSGMKPKDLVGIPWRVAFALQQPYYTGRIKDERERIWLAAMVEAEGCMFIHKRKVGQSNGQGYERKSDSYGSGLEVASTDRAIVERCMEIAGKGSIGQQTKGRNRTLYRWMLRSNECRDVIRELYPHMVAKQHEARLLIGCPSSGPKAAAAHTSLMALHNGQPATIDFPAPDTLFEPGWYVRSDVIWSKLNPMPESVTDRPTKAHEYVFLLTKQPRYYFDAEAVREEYAPKTLTHRGGGRAAGKVGQQDANGKVASGNFGEWDKPRTAYPPPVPQVETLDGSEGEAPRGPDGRRRTHVEGGDGSIQHRDGERWPNGGRNIRSVWEIATQPYPEAHFATYPEELVRRCLLAGCPEWVCRECGKPRERIVAASYDAEGRTTNGPRSLDQRHETAGFSQRLVKSTSTTGWSDCGHNDYRPGLVLDPFMGSGTTAHVARKHGRHAIGIDLNESYLELAARRLQQLSLFAEGAA